MRFCRRILFLINKPVDFYPLNVLVASFNSLSVYFFVVVFLCFYFVCCWGTSLECVYPSKIYYMSDIWKYVIFFLEWLSFVAQNLEFFFVVLKKTNEIVFKIKSSVYALDVSISHFLYMGFSLCLKENVWDFDTIFFLSLFLLDCLGWWWMVCKDGLITLFSIRKKTFFFFFVVIDFFFCLGSICFLTLIR